MEKAIHKHYSEVRRVLIIVLFLNWAVAAAKIFIGLLSKSASMTADGFHSFSDGASNIVGFVGIALACMPRDKDHPYGHKKYETFFSLGIAFLLGIVCFQLVEHGIQRIQNPVIPNITYVSFLVMIVTILVNIAVMKYENDAGKRLGSDILVSDAMHTKADVLTSISVIVTFIAIKMGFFLLDAIATLLIALFIAYAAYEIIKEGSRVLCDTVVDMDMDKIKDIVLGIKGVQSCHKIRTRGRPDDINVDLHVQVPPDMPIKKAHQISYDIEHRLKKEIPEISDIIVHLEPKE